MQNRLDISHNLACFCCLFLKLTVGKGNDLFYGSWKYDRKHRLESELYNVFPTIWNGTDSPLPWRLSPDQLDEVDMRVRSLVYPHRCEVVGNISCSFWKRISCVTKMSQKMVTLLYIIPTCLRGCVPLVYSAICDLVLGLRMLDGMVHSFNTCVNDLGIVPGSHCLRKTDIVIAEKHILKGLSKLEGCWPVSQHHTHTPHTPHTH